MALGEKLKEIYYSGEEKWYSFWDKVDSHIPVYKIIDPIDSVVPSFALFLILIFLILFGVIIGLSGAVLSDATLKLTIVDSEGNSVSGAKITLADSTEEYFSNNFGLVSDIKVPLYSTVSVTVVKGGEPETFPVIINSQIKEHTIKLSAPKEIFFQKSIKFQTETTELATGEINLTYSCSTNDLTATPVSDTIYGGTANINQSEKCGTLSVQVSSPKYETATFTVTGTQPTFTLTEKEITAKGKVTVNLKYNGTLITESVKVQAYLAQNSFIPVETKSSSNGQVIFELTEGDYKFKTMMESGYKAKESTAVSVLSSGMQTVEIPLEKQFLGQIKLTTKQGSAVLSGVHLVLNKKTSTGYTEIISVDTNSSGEATIDVTENGPYVVIATKDNYCDASSDVNIGDNKIISMKLYDGTCGNNLKIRVVDQDGKPVAYAKAAIFAETADDLYKLPYAEKATDFNGKTSWNPIKNSIQGEKYKIFAFKASYSGWSTAKEFSALSANEEFLVTLEVPTGIVKIKVKDNDESPIQFAEVQLFDEYSATSVTGRRMVENADGTIEFNVKADKKVYAVIKKEGYETYTTLPKQVNGNGTITIDVQLSKPPVEQLKVNFLGLFKNDSRALKVEANQEYEARFEIIAPKDYDELGFFLRVGKDNVTKTELDKIYIKETIAPANKFIVSGSTYNKPKGYSIDEQYLNLEESKWTQVIWSEGGYETGKIIVGAKVKIRQTAQPEERLDIGYRAWGVIDGDYERDLYDNELGAAQSKSAKQELYASTKEEYVTVGIETLCDEVSADKSFCITSTYTDPENFTHSFVDSFDAKNNSTYDVSIKILNNSLIGFDKAQVKIENAEENLYLQEYTLVTPKYETKQGTINGYETDWIDVPSFVRNSAIDFITIRVTPQKTGSGAIKIRIREGNSLVFEKTFTVIILSDKKMKLSYMKGSEFGTELPDIVSGKVELLTLKAKNSANDLEIEDAAVKLFDRFGTMLYETITNKMGVATVQIPASFPGEKLTLKVEKEEYETAEKEIKIAEEIVTTDPTSLSFTVNPQNKPADIKTVKIMNKTGLDLIVREIKLTGKLKGLLSESQIESWFDNYIGKKILAQDYEEFDFKVISSTYVPTADDLDGVFEITLGAEGKEWVKEVDAKIRVGLGKDVDNPSCLEVTRTLWEQTTRGQQIETSLEVKNNCTVDGKPVALKNLGATISTAGTVVGTFNAQSSTVQVELGNAYARIFKTTMNAGEKVPVTIKFTPQAGSAGVATGSIVFEAQNQTDSKQQKITAEMKYNLNYENIQDCIVIGSDLVSIDEGSSGSFSITNNCKTKTDLQLDLGDMQAAVSEKTFSLNAGEGKDVQITAQEGQIPGAYNILVFARQQGTTLELIDNVKIIVEPKSSCFKLTRYEYDVYDSPFNEFDGIDRGYLKNECVQKTTGAKVTGLIPFDDWGPILSAMVIGGITGYATSGKLWPWSDKKNGSITGTSKNKDVQADTANGNVNGIVQGQVNELTAAGENYVDGQLKTVNADAGMNNPEQVGEQSKKLQDDIMNELKQEDLTYSPWYNHMGTRVVNGVGSGAKIAGTVIWDNIKSAASWVKNAVIAPAEETVRVSFADLDPYANLKEKLNASARANDALVKEIRSMKDFIPKEFKKIQDARTKAAGKVNAARQQVLQKAGAKTNEIKLLTTQGKAPTKDQMDEQYKQIVADGTTAIQQAYNESATEFDKTLGEVKGNAAERLKGLKAKLEAFKKTEEDFVIELGKTAGVEIAKDAKGQAVQVKKNSEDLAAEAKIKLDLENKIQGLGKEVSGLKAEIAAANADYTTNYTINYDTWLSRISNAQSALKTKEDDLADAKQKLPGSSAKVTKLETAQKGFANLETIQSNINNLTQDITDVQGLVDKLNGVSVQKVETKNDGSLNPAPATGAKVPVKPSAAAPQPNEAAACKSGETLVSGVCCQCDKKSYLGYAYYHDIKNDLWIMEGQASWKFSEEEVKEQIAAFAQGSLNGGSVSKAALPPSVSGSSSKTFRVGEVTTIAELNSYGFVSDGGQVDGDNVYKNSDRTAIYVGAGAKITQIAPTIGGPVKEINVTKPVGSVAFILATSTSSTSSTGSSPMNVLGQVMFPAMTGAMGGSMLGGALVAGLTALMQVQDTKVDYSDSFVVPLVEFTGASLESPEGIQMNVGEVTYDYDSYYGMSSTGKTTSSGTGSSNSSSSSSGNNSSAYTGNVLMNNQALSATMGLVEIREIEFTNPNPELQNRSMYEPFTGVMTVTGTEKIYNDKYEYDYIKKQALARGEEVGEVDREGILGTIQDLFVPKTEIIAEMKAEDLEVKETRNYEKKFHLLFDAWEYVSCGPKTFPCQARELSNCDVDGKKGVTGEEGTPKIKLKWNWSEIGIDDCDSDATANYIYCDTTQFSTMILKRVIQLREYMKANNLSNCPSAIDIVSTKTQKLNENTQDVGITSVTAKPTTDGAIFETIVATNNNLEMKAKVSFKFTREDGTVVANVCPDKELTFTSETKYECVVKQATAGTGSFNVDITMTPTLCTGCGNYDTSNDTMKTALVIGSTGATQCSKYVTSKDYFEKVMTANNALDTKILGYISFKANLIKDGFSSDFKEDYDAFLHQVAQAPTDYEDTGVRELFLSDKFEFKWPSDPASWEAGKYDARILVTFKNNSWNWDNNNIESIVIDLAPQGDPDPDYPIYDVAFNGMVGLDSDDGRQGYGASYVQKTEDLFVVANDQGTEVTARPNASDNGVTTVNVSVIKGTQAFYLLNSSPTRANMLSISRAGDSVDFVITPNVAVPLILNITRGTSIDAYAFYSAEVNGQPQETGSSFISWTGIGQGCVDPTGMPMSGYYNTPDRKANGLVTGFEGYGLYFPMSQLQGTASWFGSIFAPQNASVVLRMTGQQDSASFESTHGNGTIISANSAGTIETLAQVIDLVQQEKVCVIGGEYYWNNNGLREDMKGQIDAKEQTCISSR